MDQGVRLPWGNCAVLIRLSLPNRAPAVKLIVGHPHLLSQCLLIHNFFLKETQYCEAMIQISSYSESALPMTFHDISVTVIVS